MFERRHYEAIVSTLALAAKDMFVGAEYVQAFVEMLAKDNPRFDAVRFREAWIAQVTRKYEEDAKVRGDALRDSR